MFKTLRNAFKVKDIRDRILFTFLMLIIIRIGSELPAPGVDGEVFQTVVGKPVCRRTWIFQCDYRWFFPEYVCIRTEYYTVHYFIHHYAAAYHCDSEA